MQRPRHDPRIEMSMKRRFPIGARGLCAVVVRDVLVRRMSGGDLNFLLRTQGDERKDSESRFTPSFRMRSVPLGGERELGGGLSPSLPVYAYHSLLLDALLRTW